MTVPNLTYILFRQRRVILGTLILATFLTVGYCWVATPQYEADESLVANFTSVAPNSPAAAPQSNQVNSVTPQDREQMINSYLLELQGTEIASEVIHSIGLKKLYPSLTAPNPLNPLSWIARLFPSDPVERAVDRFTTKDLEVTVAHDSNVITVSFFNPNRYLAQRALTLLVDKFLERQARIGRNPQLEFVKSQVKFYRDQVLVTQSAMESFETLNGITSIDDEQTTLLQQRSYQEELVTATQTRIGEDTKRTADLSSQLAHLSRFITTATGNPDPLVQSARATLGGLVAEDGKLRQTYAADSQPIRDIDTQISQVKEMIAREAPRAQLESTMPDPTYENTKIALLSAQADLDAANEALSRQTMQLTQINSRLNGLDHARGTYQNLLRDYELADQNYRSYLQSVQQARIDDDLDTQKITTISVFNSAYALSRPAKPRIVIIVLGGVLLGLIGGFSLAFLNEELDERMNLPWHVTDTLGLPLLGSMGELAVTNKR